MELLYYAGMAADGITEQIGVAVREEGGVFVRAGDRGLVIPRDPTVWWRSARACNPMVLRAPSGEFVMYYHGAQATETGKTITHAMGRATSRDGLSWDTPGEPLLSWRDMVAIDPIAETGRGIGLIEPCVAYDGTTWRMWFVYTSPSFPGNALFEATSHDGERFQISPTPLVIGSALGGRALHYPQVLGNVIWFTLRNGTSTTYAVAKAPLAEPTQVEMVLPASPTIGPRWHLPQVLRGVPGSVRLNRWLNLSISGGRAYFGYAHPHVMGDGRTMYYHAYHLGSRGAWMDIGRCTLAAGGGPTHHEVVLRTAEDIRAWDGFFVADPFVLEV
jgi:hypothetical protein